MSEQQQRTEQSRPCEARWRRVGVIAFAGGFLGALGFFGFFPGLPHVIDWGAVLVALAVGGLLRWACLAWVRRR